MDAPVPVPALKVRPFATAASAAAPRRIVRAPIWMWAASADGAIPPPVPEAYEAAADAPAPFRLGSALQDPYADYSGARAGSGADADAGADHNFSWNEFTKDDGEKAKLLETAANMAALARAMARMKAAEKAAAKAAAEAAARAAAAEAEPRSHSV